MKNRSKTKPMTEQEMVLYNVNLWRKKNKLPPAGHESPKQFKANFNSIASKLGVAS
jgi:hypothetical protein